MGLTPPELIKQALAKHVVERVDGTGMMPASVMILLYFKDGEYCILLNKRSKKLSTTRVRFPSLVEPGTSKTAIHWRLLSVRPKKRWESSGKT
jgi:hypothetical protein